MKHLMKAIITLLMIFVIFLASCDDLTPAQNDILNDAKATVTENTTVKEFIDEISKQIEKHADNETVWYIPKQPAEEPEMEYPKLVSNMFNEGEAVLVENTVENYVFRIDYYKDGKPVSFYSKGEKIIWVRIVEGDIPEISYKIPYNYPLVYAKKFYVFGSSDTISVPKGEISAEHDTMNVFFTTVPDYFLGGYFGPESTAGPQLDTTIWLTIPR